MSWRHWVEPRAADENVARQEQLVIILSLVSAVAACFYLLGLAGVALTGGTVSLFSLLGGVLAVLLAVCSYYLVHRGLVRPAAILIVTATAAIGLYSAYVRGTESVAVVMLTPAILFAAMAIGGRASILTALGEFAGYLTLGLAQRQGWVPRPDENLSWVTGVVLAASSLALIAVIGWQTIRSLERSIQRIQERSRMLQDLAGEKDRLLAELQAREQAQNSLLQTVRELGSPVIPLAPGVIAMPLIGAIDSVRAQQIITDLLQGVVDNRARVAIVDVTGVPIVDTAVAGALLKAAQGVRLLGAESVWTGMRPEVAQTVVALGLDLSGVTTRATLQEGLAYALEAQRKR